MQPTSRTSSQSDLCAPPARARSHTVGFTLVELTIVIVILAILFFALEPAFLGLVRNARHRAAIRSLVALLNYSRTEAVGTGRLVRVMCAPDEGLFWAEAQVDPGMDRSLFEPLAALGQRQTRMPDPLRVARLVVSGQQAAQGAQIYFYPDGRTDGADLILEDDSGREFAVELSPATGRVYVSD